MWTLLLSETFEPDQPFLAALPGVRRLWERLWLYEGAVEKEVLFAQSPLLGPVYARPLLVAPLEDLRRHPAVEYAARGLARELYYALVNGSPKAEALEELLGLLGREDLRAEAEGLAARYRSMHMLLSVVGAPHRPGEPGEVILVHDTSLTLSSLEEVERVARTYRWAREAGVGLRPAARGPKGELSFYVDLLRGRVEGDKAVFPLAANGVRSDFLAPKRSGSGVAFFPVRISAPKEVRLLFLPHR